MSDTYCELCDADPCWCGRHGEVEIQSKTVGGTHSGPKGLEGPMREFVLTEYANDTGVLDNWAGWLERIVERFGGNDRTAVRNAWNRVSNQLQRDWLLIDDPAGEEGPLRAPHHYPDARHMSLAEATAAVEELIASGGWVAGEKGLRLWQVRRRIPNSVYINIWDALHDMNKRGHLVTTMSPDGHRTMFWYVRE